MPMIYVSQTTINNLQDSISKLQKVLSQTNELYNELGGDVNDPTKCKVSEIVSLESDIFSNIISVYEKYTSNQKPPMS